MDTMEMGEMGERETNSETRGEEETSFTDQTERQMDESILIMDGSNPVFVRPDVDTDTPGGSVPEPITRRQVGVVKRLMIHDKKQFLKDGLGITVNKRDGPNSSILFDKLRTTTSGKTNKINGATYKGKKILILRNGKMEYSTDRSKLSYVNEFKDLLKKADKEHQKTTASLVEKTVGVDITQETMDSIVDRVSDEIDSRIDDITEDFTTNTEITNNELRELRGILNVKVNRDMTSKGGEEKIRFLEVERDHWKTESEKPGTSDMKSKLYDAVSKMADLKIEQIRLRTNQLPETDEVRSMVEEEGITNDRTKFEKFKKWVRSNFTTLSLTLITVGGVVTSIVMSVRSGVSGAANALKKVSKSLSDMTDKINKKFNGDKGDKDSKDSKDKDKPSLLSKLWDVVKGLGKLGLVLLKILSKIIRLLSKFIFFLGENLWLLFMIITYMVYNEFKDWKQRRQRK